MQIILAHGASGTAASMGAHVEGLRRRGLDALAIDLPKRRAEDAVAAYRQAVPQLAGSIIGGHSYGGRVASLLAAEEPPRGLVDWQSRSAHWSLIRCPTLLLSGEADPFARLELLREAVALLPNAELVTYPRLRHGLGPVLDDALDRLAAFAARLEDGGRG